MKRVAVTEADAGVGTIGTIGVGNDVPIAQKLRSRSCYRSTPKRRVIIDWQGAQTNNVIRNVGNLPGITGEHESSTG